MPVDVSMIGDKSLERMLRRLPDAVHKKILRKAFRKGAKIILVEALANVQRMTEAKSGKLRTGLHIRALPRSRYSLGVRVKTKPRSHFGIPPEDVAQMPWFYPTHVELGHKHAKPRPYLRNAFDTKEAAALKVIQLEARAGIDQEAMKP